MLQQDKDKTRIDKYLWAIRVFKTRSIATDACKAGKIKLDQNSIKSSHIVKIGDIYHIQKDQRKIIIKVIDILDKRLDAKSVAIYFEDLSVKDDTPRFQSVFTSPVLQRARGTGRPTKKERREIDEIQQSWEDDD